MKPLRTWILIADGARARILENHGPRHEPIVVEGLNFSADHSATRDLVSDRQGRSFASQGTSRSALEPRSDPHRQLKKGFAHHLADILASELERNSFSRLILVAPPATLGDLRAAISDQVRATIVGESAHDLTKTPNHEIAKHLGDLLFAPSPVPV